MSGSLGSQSQKTDNKSTENVTKSPLAAQLPAWNSIWTQAGSLAGRDYTTALQPTADAYTRVGQDTAGSSDAVRKLGLDTVGGRYLDANEYLNPAIAAATKGTWDKFSRETLPGLAAHGNASGAYGGARNSLAVGQAAGDAMGDALSIGSQLAYENYARERAAQQAGASLLTDASALGGAGAGYLGEGATVQDQGQMAMLAQLAEILSAGGFGQQAGVSTAKGSGKTSGFSLGFSNKDG